MSNASAETPLLELRDLRKHFRSYWAFRRIHALHGVSLQIAEGESFGFLGHNGAGKTTTIKSIVGLIQASSGEILFKGAPLSQKAQRAQIGYLPEQPYFYDHLSVWETLEFFAALYGIPAGNRKTQIKKALELVHLEGRDRSSVRSLSKGLQQRVALAQAILNEPKLLLLDEPFSGLDPIGRKEVRDLILSLRAAGTTIFLSSHILSDVEDICDRVAIMSKGELKQVFSLSEVTELYGQSFELVLAADADFTRGLSDVIESSTQDTSSGPRSTVRFASYQGASRAITHAQDSAIDLVSFQTKGRSLEEIFVATTSGANFNSDTSGSSD